METDSTHISEDEDEAEEYEPQVTSADPEERKLARRLRIQRRIEVIKKQYEQDGFEIENEDEKSLLEKQIEASADILEQLLVEGNEVVTNVRVGNDTREVNHRENEAKHRAELIEKLENEAKEAEEIYEQITRKWDVISNYKDPLDISDSISLQHEQCDELIKQKDEIIAMLREEIDKAELKYVQDQEIQKDDISTLVKRIDNQIDLMRKSYKNELKLIDDAIETEKKMLVEANNKKWEALYKQRNIEEENNMQKKIELSDNFLEEFTNVRIEHEEKFRETKIALESENEVLQQELEHLKASCLLNAEKLDYNYNILKKREEENLIIRSQQKRLINKLQDEINAIKKSCSDYRNNSYDTINNLTAEIKKMRNSILQLDAKADHICEMNDRKYHAVWQLNEDNAKELMDKIRTTDKIIHEQLLGLEYKYSKKTFIKKVNLPSFREAREELNYNKGQSANSIFGDKRSLNLKIEKRNSNEDEKDVPVYLLQNILEKIAFRSGFLMEDSLNEILMNMAEKDQNLIKADNVFNAIGISKEEHLKIIIDLFLPYARCPICERGEKVARQDSKIIPTQAQTPLQPKSTRKSSTSLDILKQVTGSVTNITNIVTSELEGDHVDDEDIVSAVSTPESTSAESLDVFEIETKVVVPEVSSQYQCQNNHPIYIEIANVFKILKNFVAAINPESEKSVTMEKRMLRQRTSLSRSLRDDDVKLFWHQFSHFCNKHFQEIWNGLLYGLQKYHEILQERQKIYKEVVVYRRENSELRHMLKYCTVEKKKKKSPRRRLNFRYTAKHR